MCAQPRLRSAWAFAQSDQSLLCPHEETLGPLLPIEHTAKTLIDWADAQADLSLRWTHTHFAGFVMSRLKRSAIVTVGLKSFNLVLLEVLQLSQECFIGKQSCELIGYI